MARGHHRRSASSLRERCHFAGHEHDPDRTSADMRHVCQGTFAKVLELLADGGDQLATSHRHCGASLMHGRCQNRQCDLLRGEICKVKPIGTSAMARPTATAGGPICSTVEGPTAIRTNTSRPLQPHAASGARTGPLAHPMLCRRHLLALVKIRATTERSTAILSLHMLRLWCWWAERHRPPQAKSLTPTPTRQRSVQALA